MLDYHIVHNEIQNRFEAHIQHQVAVVDYIPSEEGIIDIVHTGVPSAFEGQGVAANLTKAVLEYARDNGLKVRPICPYTVKYMQRHTEYDDLLV